MSKKKLVAMMMATVMIVAGIVLIPKQTDAAVAADTITYKKYDDITTYTTATPKKAPIKEGYVFGGWYTAEEEDAFIAEEDIASVTSAYAKFVPAQVLSVKAQNMAETEADTEKTYVRVMASLDSTNYQKVGFDIWLSNKKQLFKDGGPLETDQIYKGLMVGDKPVYATDIYGCVSKYISAWQLSNVAKKNYGEIIYVRPYWITMDGTKVEGLAKYVHIEDEYLDLISVPVNLLSGETVAAGAMDKTYNTTLTFKEFEPGRLFPEMECNPDTANKTIKMVGNAEFNTNVKADGIYANIRFEMPSADTDFEMTPVLFCDWDEKTVELEKVWDVKYVK